MSRLSSRLSHRYNRSHSRLSRPKSAAPCLHQDPDVILEEDDGPPRPHTSLHFYPEDEDPTLTDKDYAHDADCQAWSLPPDPEPLKLVKKYGYGYRKPEKELTPHWSQWPQPPQADKPQHKDRRHVATFIPHYVHQKKTRTPQAFCDPAVDTNHYNENMTTRMKYGDERNIIMHRGLSPRRAAPPVMPGRSLTQYGSFENRDYIASLDLSAAPFYSTGFRQGHMSRSCSRESRPMHRHLRTARQDEGYLHNRSIYYSTTPNVSGYYIIHPDWVSERLSMRRSQSLLAF